ncbi:MAG: hypothetical protein ACFFAQ_05075 [Promethearchaeota archaeon]
MARREIVAIIIMIVFGFSIIISIPIFFITLGFSPYISIDHQEYRKFIFNSSTVIDLKLEIDVGNVDIKYTYDPIDYHARVDLNIEMIGQNIPSKNYSDYFDIEWDNTDSSFTFTMELLAESEFDDIIWEKKDINLVVTLNPAILFNINTTITKEGDVSLLAPGITIDNVDIYCEEGNIYIDFIFCTIGGNITGIVGVGNIDLKAINVQYAQNSVWNLTENFEGDIYINITQNTTLTANITGYCMTNEGVITLVYTDKNTNVGAMFTFFKSMGQRSPEPITSVIGFEFKEEELPPNGLWITRYIFNSLDFPAIGNYNISFYGYNEGSYLVNLKND